MAFNGLRFEYALEGSSNYIAWKENMEVVLENNGLKEFIDSDVLKPTSADTAVLDVWQKKVARARRITLEGVKYHVVSNLHGRATSFVMWKALADIFQSCSDHKKFGTEG